MATQPNPPADPSENWYAYYRFDPNRDSPNEARNTLLIVGALIAAVTFQAGINPPGGVTQAATTVNNVTIPVGTAILGSNKSAFPVFLFLNTLAFSSSVQMITFLILDCPFSFEVLTSIYCMFFTYGFAIASVIPPGAIKPGYLTIALALPYVVRLLQKLPRKWQRG